MLSKRARERIEEVDSTSMVIDLKMWLKVCETYEEGGHMYYTTMPTNALRVLRDVMRESTALGYANLKQWQTEMGVKMRAMLASKGVKSVAAPEFAAPSVIVS